MDLVLDWTDLMNQSSHEILLMELELVIRQADIVTCDTPNNRVNNAASSVRAMDYDLEVRCPTCQTWVN